MRLSLALRPTSAPASHTLRARHLGAWLALMCVWVSLGVVGCHQQASLPVKWASDDVMRAPDDGRFPDAPAEILLRRVRMMNVAQRGAFSQYQHHEVRRIRTEGGFSAAEQRLRLDEGAELVQFGARTIAPDGTVHEIGREALIWGTEIYKEEESQVGSFRLPHVEVGSVLEVAYTIQSPYYFIRYDGEVSDVFPVRKYRLDLRGNDKIKMAFRAYNIDAKPVKTDIGDEWRLTLNVDDIPADESEPLAPHRTVSGKYWSYRTTKVVWNHKYQSVYKQSWAQLMQRRVKRIFAEPEKAVGAFAVPLDVAGCADVRCKLERAIAQSRELVQPGEGCGGFWNARPLELVAKSGVACSTERVMLMIHWLSQAGVEVQPVFATRRFSRRFDRKRPDGDWINEFIVRLPAQKGLDAPIWVAPACDYCGVGELPRTLMGTEGVVTWKDGDDYHAELMPIDGSFVPVPELEQESRVVLAADGSATVELRERTTGWMAQSIHRWRSRVGSERWARAVDASMRSMFHDADGEGAERPACDRARGECTFTQRFAVPHYAEGFGDAMAVPMHVLDRVWDNDLLDPERTSDVVIERDQRVVQRVRFALPEGYEVRELPAPLNVSSPAFDVQFEIAVQSGELAVEGSDAAVARVAGSAGAQEVVASRTLTVRAGHYPVAGYGELRAALRALASARDSICVVEKVPVAPAQPEAPPAPEGDPATQDPPAEAQ